MHLYGNFHKLRQAKVFHWMPPKSPHNSALQPNFYSRRLLTVLYVAHKTSLNHDIPILYGATINSIWTFIEEFHLNDSNPRSSIRNLSPVSTETLLLRKGSFFNHSLTRKNTKYSLNWIIFVDFPLISILLSSLKSATHFLSKDCHSCYSVSFGKSGYTNNDVFDRQAAI